jgi:mutator protein MutT
MENERNEWELPGGGIELNETPEECVIREIQEEVNISCEVKKIIDSWVYEVLPGQHVFIVTYLCKPQISDITEAKMSDEHSDLQWTPLSEIERVYMPEGYKQSIKQVFSL